MFNRRWVFCISVRLENTMSRMITVDTALLLLSIRAPKKALGIG